MTSKKDLKTAYKQMKFRMGVFQIRNTLNNKVFVESSTNLDAIFNRHRMQLNLGNHPNTMLQKDWTTMGEAHFSYEILEEIEQGDKAVSELNKAMKMLETVYLEDIMPFGEKGYNTKDF